MSCERESKPVPPDATVTIRGRTWQVEIARTRAQQALGLAHREEVPPGTGMLFVFQEPDEHSFWMQGCLVPLDIAFIDADRVVRTTYTMYVEPDLRGRTHYPSRIPVLYALEVPAGELAAAGVQVGDTVDFSPEVTQP